MIQYASNKANDVSAPCLTINLMNLRIPVHTVFQTEIREQNYLISILFPLFRFQLRFYCVRLLYLCCICKHITDDVTTLVMHRVFTTNL